MSKIPLLLYGSLRGRNWLHRLGLLGPPTHILELKDTRVVWVSCRSRGPRGPHANLVRSAGERTLCTLQPVNSAQQTVLDLLELVPLGIYSRHQAAIELAGQPLVAASLYLLNSQGEESTQPSPFQKEILFPGLEVQVATIEFPRVDSRL